MVCLSMVPVILNKLCALVGAVLARLGETQVKQDGQWQFKQICSSSHFPTISRHGRWRGTMPSVLHNRNPFYRKGLHYQ